MENKKIEEQLILLPTTIAELQGKMINSSKNLTELQVMSKQEVSREIINIYNATDETGKKLYNRERERNAVLQERLAESAGYKNLTDKLLALKEESARLEIEIQKNINLFLAYKAIAGMRSGGV